MTRFEFQVEESFAKARLEDYLCEKFPNLSKMYLRELIKNEKCEVNGVAVAPDAWKGAIMTTTFNGNPLKIRVTEVVAASQEPELDPWITTVDAKSNKPGATYLYTLEYETAPDMSQQVRAMLVAPPEMRTYINDYMRNVPKK